MPENADSASVRMPEASASVGGAPAAAGMLTPQAPDGDIAAAKLDAYHAVRLLDRAIAKLGQKSEHADALLRARATLTSQFGEIEEDSERFSPAEIKRMLSSLVGAGDPGQQPQPAKPPPGQPAAPGAQ